MGQGNTYSMKTIMHTIFL